MTATDRHPNPAGPTAWLGLSTRSPSYGITWGFEYSAPATRWSIAFLLLIVAAGGWACCAAHAADAATSAPSAAILHLANGDFVAGELREADNGAILRWQSAAFTAPFDFAVEAISTVRFAPPAQRPQATGDYCFELAAGDALFGTLRGLTAENVEVETAAFGTVQVQRASVRRLSRWNSAADAVYLGPNGLTGWIEPKNKKDWREEAGHLTTDKLRAAAFGDFGLPAQACVEVELSWTKKADFVLALGVAADWQKEQKACALEVWDSDVVFVRETETAADVAIVQAVSAGPPQMGRLQVQVYLDQPQGRAIVCASNGKQIADLRVAGDNAETRTGIRLTNGRGDVRLERLRITRWNGLTPREVETAKSRLHRTDGTIVYGQVTSYDAGAQQFVIRGDGGEQRLPATDIQSVYLPSAGEEKPRAVRLALHDGTRLSGDITRVADGSLWLQCPDLRAPLHPQVAALDSVVVLRNAPAPAPNSGRAGRLDVDGLKLQGMLVDGREQPTASCLTWQPHGSRTASPLRPGAAGTIVYREPSPKPPARRSPPEPPQPAGAGERPPSGATGGAPRPGPTGASRRLLHLRTGDIIPCDVTGIDERGVTLKTPQSDATFVAHDKIRVLEMTEAQRPARIDKVKFERLLTLPRLQQDNPPTQLVQAVNGDYLRGRILAMDETLLTIEVRLESRTLRRDRVARIIWLHNDELAAEKAKPAAPPSTTATRVQALRSDGIRLTWFPEQVAGAVVSGRSDVLGTCRVDVNQVDRLLIGSAIDRATQQLAYQAWKLQKALEPKAAPDDAGGTPDGPPTGTESPLVGQPAPDFKLKLLDGKEFHLAGQRGRVVVLDFWASWCGPCLQLMPEVARVAEGFADGGVQLLAVNLLEPKDRIAATLERLKLQTAVALDSDGKVAEQYGATAIPQTVVIDRQGKIVRLFVGGGPRFTDQLREVLAALVLADKPPAADSTPPPRSTP